MATKLWTAHLCVLCGFLYEEEPPGVFAKVSENQPRWEELPDSWRCPDCGARKSFFEKIEINLPTEESQISL
ncbi:MAG TPA: rubredoxin [Methylothermaceae bacterium]|nr:rubredoxin [Methylothermaceae bacterium]